MTHLVVLTGTAAPAKCPTHERYQWIPTVPRARSWPHRQTVSPSMVTVVTASEVLQDEPMRQFSPLLCWTAVVVATTAGCGAPATTPTDQGQPAVFPVTITRTGGIAGFGDVLVVAGDGLVSVTRKGHTPRRCQLTPAAVQRLTTSASTVTWSRITPANTRASFPDDMVTTMSSPAGGPVRLEDPQAGATGQLFLELLNDLNDGPSASHMCRPV